jgi:hypothetical protein
MAEPEVEAAWGAEFKRIHATEAFHSGSDDPKATFRWSGDEAEPSGSKRSTPTTIFGGRSLALSLL